MLRLYYPSKTVPITNDIIANLIGQSPGYISIFPECRHHPSDQLRMGDAFLERAETSDVYVITFSEHILSRILRRIAEKPKLRERVRVYIWNVDSNRLTLLNIDEDGQITNAPPGWLEEGYQEASKHVEIIEQKQKGGANAPPA